MSWLNGLVSKAVGAPQTSSASALINKLQTATTSEERKKLVHELKSASEDEKQAKAIGEGISVIFDAIRADRSDLGNIRAAIQVLINDREKRKLPDSSVQAVNVGRIVDDCNNTALLLSLLEEADKNVRFFTMRLLTILMANRSGEVQAALLQSPVSITMLMDLVQGGSEMIRNETLLMLIELTKTNVEIQKIVAFGPREGSAFELLLSIIEQEGLGNGGIVVQDCLHLLNNLLRGSISNQNYFRETRCIPRLPALLALEKSDMWILTDDKQTILCLTLETISLLLSPQNPASYNHQSIFRDLGVVSTCMQLALAGINSPSVRTRALWALGDLLRGHDANRADFELARFASPEQTVPITGLAKLCSVMLNSKVLSERRASLHALSYYLSGNEPEKKSMASSLASADGSVGSELVKTMLSWSSQAVDLNRFMYASSALIYTISGTTSTKDIFSKSTIDGDLLLLHCLRSLITAVRTQADVFIQIMLARLILTWADDYEPASRTILQNQSFMQLAVEILNQQSQNIHISGLFALLAANCFYVTGFHSGLTSLLPMAQFVEKLDLLKNTDEFKHAEEQKFEEMSCLDDAKPLIYDHEFTIIVKKLFDKVSGGAGNLSPSRPSGDSILSSAISYEEHENVVTQYKDLVKQADQRAEQLRLRCTELESQLLKLTRNPSGGPNVEAQLRLENDQLRKAIQERDLVIQQQDKRLRELESSSRIPSGVEVSLLRDQLEGSKKNELVLQEQVAQLLQERDANKTTTASSSSSFDAKHIANQDILKRFQDLSTAFESLQKDHDELLICLAQVETENAQFRKKLGLVDEDLL